ncbi:Protein son of sevenless [Camponotus floridanus]|uniref:Protein son of sevenless n=1 Tax=Camponotus floridanus TaxID=104421 RepID=E2AT28_CAMFO|nr:Protein son of sevenless [Camponotus floridanus]
MVYWRNHLKVVLMELLMEYTTKDSTEKIQPEVTNHLADINQHFHEYLVRDISLQSAYVSLTKLFERKRKSSKAITLHFKNRPPPIESHLKIPENNENYGILTIHPVELARQLTLLEFQLYSAVKSFELVGCVWTKDDKNERSPNLLKMIRHTTNFTRWLEKIIVDAQNFKERVAIVLRAIEIMVGLQDLNNFNGVLAIFSALESASVFWLKFSVQQLSIELQEALTKARQLSNNYVRKYKEVLQLIDPPCVPFLSIYLINIMHLEEGNRDYLPENPNLINFNKWRKVAEIIGEIQLYQNKPYCLSVESKIRQYIENMCPFDPNMSEANISNYLYSKSLEIEPNKCKAPPQFPRKWPEIKLKSPGIKTSRSLSGKSPTPLQTVVSSKLHPPPLELPETPPHAPQVTVPHIGDHSIFAPVILVSAVSSRRSPNRIPTPPSPGNISPSQLRPPLPPKPSRSRKSSFSESSQQVGQAPNAPVLPPRDAQISPPPLPPRRDILPSQPNGFARPRLSPELSLPERPSSTVSNFNTSPGPS